MIPIVRLPALSYVRAKLAAPWFSMSSSVNNDSTEVYPPC